LDEIIEYDKIKLIQKGRTDMEVKEALLKRRSIRKFKEDLISDEIIEELLHAAMSAPSACNRRPWEFYVVTNKDKLLELKKASRFARYDAPLAIVVCGNLSKALPLSLSTYWIQDCSAATENILLRVTDLNLGAVWCGAHPQKKVEENIREILNISEKEVPLNIIFIGYPIEESEPRDQYDIKKIHYIK
jgi:nitroreductase